MVPFAYSSRVSSSQVTLFSFFVQMDEPNNGDPVLAVRMKVSVESAAFCAREAAGRMWTPDMPCTVISALTIGDCGGAPKRI